MRPSDWGPLVWDLLHGLAQLSPGDIGIINELPLSLPCAKCRRNVVEHLRLLDRDKSPQHQVWWLHNQVNVSLGKPEMPFKLKRRSITWLKLAFLGAVFVHNVYPDPKQYQAARRLLAVLAKAGKFTELSNKLGTNDIPEAFGFDRVQFQQLIVKWFGPRY